MSSHDDDYEVSSHVVHSIFDKLTEVTAVAYPSRRQINAINFAVRVERFWNDWGLRSVRRAQATHLACGYYRLHDVLHVEGITDSGAFVWSHDPGPEGTTAILDPLYAPH